MNFELKIQVDNKVSLKIIFKIQYYLLTIGKDQIKHILNLNLILNS